MTDVFGDIVDGNILEAAMLQTLEDWLPTYIQEIELQRNLQRGQISPPNSFTTRNIWEHYPEEQLPAIIVVSPGLAAPPKKEGNGQFSGVWMIGAGVIISGADETGAKLLSKIYAAAIRSIVLQHSSLGGVSSGVEWYDESYDDIPDTDEMNRYLASGVCYFRIKVDGIANSRGGPRVPSAPFTSGGIQPDTWPSPDPATQPGTPTEEVETVTVTLTKEDL